MARARNIKPGFCRNEDLAECSIASRLCFALLPMLADREGRLEDRPKRIKGELFPFDSFDVEPLLQELEARGFIARYTTDGLAVIQILAFSKHQNPHHREPESTLPKHPSLRLDGDGKYQKPQASLLSDDGKASDKPEALTPSQAPKASDKPEASLGLDPPRVDLARGSNRADSLIPDSLIPDSRPSGVEPGALLTSMDLEAEGVDPQHAKDWLKVRKAKKLPLTPTAWARFKADAWKARMSPAQGVQHCAGKGWAGFYTERQPAGQGGSEDAFAGAL